MTALTTLFETLQQLQARKNLPPVHLWQPETEGEIDIRIDADGTWFHEGGRFQRQSLADLFATILRREQDDYYLVTPAEKLRIQVEDVPFVAIDVDARGEGESKDLLFTTSVGDYILAGEENQVWMRDGKPYVHIRHGLEARVQRAAYYRLIDEAVVRGEDMVVWSQGTCFSLGKIS